MYSTLWGSGYLISLRLKRKKGKTLTSSLTPLISLFNSSMCIDRSSFTLFYANVVLLLLLLFLNSKNRISCGVDACFVGFFFSFVHSFSSFFHHHHLLLFLHFVFLFTIFFFRSSSSSLLSYCWLLRFCLNHRASLMFTFLLNWEALTLSHLI